MDHLQSNVSLRLCSMRSHRGYELLVCIAPLQILWNEPVDRPSLCEASGGANWTGYQQREYKEHLIHRKRWPTQRLFCLDLCTINDGPEGIPGFCSPESLRRCDSMVSSRLGGLPTWVRGELLHMTSSGEMGQIDSVLDWKYVPHH